MSPLWYTLVNLNKANFDISFNANSITKQIIEPITQSRINVQFLQISLRDWKCKHVGT